MENTVEKTEETKTETATEEVLLEKVDSSNINAIGFEADSTNEVGTLYVRFSEGQIYSYEAVPRALHEEFLAAESKGSFFAQNIKNKTEYPHTKLGAEFKHRVVEKEEGSASTDATKSVGNDTPAN